MKQAVLAAVHQAVDKAGERFRRGRGGNLVLRQMDRAFLCRRIEHAVNKVVRADAVQPRRTHDNMLVGQFAHELFTGVLALAVHRGRMGIVELTESLVLVAAEYVIGRDLNEFCVDASCSGRQIAGADGVDLIRFFGVLLAGLHVGQAGTVNDDIRMVNIGETADNGYILNRYIAVAGYQLICCVAAETMTKRGTQSAACSRDPNAGCNTVHKTPLLSARCSGTAPARITHFMGCIFSIAQNC